MKHSKRKNAPAHQHLPGMKNMRCPYCRSPVRFRSADGIYKTNPNGVQLLVCSRYPECDAYVSVVAGTKTPMGSLANKQLRTLRRRAHEHFNCIYKNGLMSKEEAYSWLACILHVPMSQAHIGYLGDYYCQVVIDESKKLLDRHGISQAVTSSRHQLPLASGGEQYARAAQRIPAD